MADMMVIAVVILIVGAATVYIIKAKKRGVKCIGCPMAGECAHKHGEASGCDCSCSENKDAHVCQTGTKEKNEKSACTMKPDMIL
ncbi:MAG: FeoB-associated Cys-rich membrane protein [Lachnospiraceae bacterium]|nr:FeoB-associated Cys-rich membrane protein [Lachnospiraceae bacterium]